MPLPLFPALGNPLEFLTSFNEFNNSASTSVSSPLQNNKRTGSCPNVYTDGSVSNNFEYICWFPETVLPGDSLLIPEGLGLGPDWPPPLTPNAEVGLGLRGLSLPDGLEVQAICCCRRVSTFWYKRSHAALIDLIAAMIETWELITEGSDNASFGKTSSNSCVVPVIRRKKKLRDCFWKLALLSLVQKGSDALSSSDESNCESSCE